jgi:hypothetical protein
MPASAFDCFDPSEVERIPRHLEFRHRDVAKFGLGQELGLIILNKLKQPIATAPRFFRSLVREFLASGRQSQLSRSPLLRCTKQRWVKAFLDGIRRACFSQRLDLQATTRFGGP